jgi:Saccharopine dehydrogenase NADP binding domain
MDLPERSTRSEPGDRAASAHPTPQRSCRILVLGASGQFGKRLCGRLIGLDGVAVLLGGRDAAKLAETRAGLLALLPAAAVELAPCDAGAANLADLLRAYEVNLVVHLAGPFQGQDYKVARACLEAGVPYIDMADGREFVAKFASLDVVARAKGIALVTGASTVPGLSSAIVDAALAKFDTLRSIDYGISASLKTGLGSATLQAVLSYCGKPYQVLDAGAATTVYGLGRPRRHDFPTPVHHRVIVDCDIPDHALFPGRYPDLRHMDFGSGIDVPGLAYMLSLMSLCVRRGWVADWDFLRGSVQSFMTAAKPFGGAHSGFFMRCEGRDAAGRHKKILLEILARDGSGLEIPVTPVVLLVGKLLAGEALPAGAYPCMGLFSLAEFQRALSSFPIAWEWKEVA